MTDEDILTMWYETAFVDTESGAIEFAQKIEQASRATPADQEPVAYEYQHDEGRVTFIDPWQKEQGWEQANDRWTLVGPVYRNAEGRWK